MWCGSSTVSLIKQFACIVIVFFPALEKEKELLDSLESGPKSNTTAPLPDVTNILANFTPTAVPQKHANDAEKKPLSKQSSGVLKELPLLSFMQATVLMFPMKEETTTAGPT